MNVALFSDDPAQLAKEANRHTRLFYHNDFAITHSVSYARLINGVALKDIKQYIGSVDRDTLSGYARIQTPEFK